MASIRRKQEEYIYSSSELSAFYGLTIKGMEFYEKKGLVHPERVGSGKMRRYSLEDSYRLYCTRMFKNCGFSIQDTIALLEDNSFDHARDALAQRMASMEREIRTQQRILEILRRTDALMSLAERGAPFYEIVDCPGFYRLFLRRFDGPHESSAEETRDYRRWNDHLPITAASLRFPLADCRLDVRRVDTRVGLIVDRQDFDQLGFRESGRTQFIPGGRFLHTLLQGSSQRLAEADWLYPALRYMRANGLRQTGDAFSRMLFVVRAPEGDRRIDEAWFPCEREEGDGT